MDYLTFNKQKSHSDHIDHLTTIQACDTNENISSHLQTIKKTSRRREMSVVRCDTETPAQNQDQAIPTEVPPRNRDEYLSTRKKSIGDPDSSQEGAQQSDRVYHTFSLNPNMCSTSQHLSSRLKLHQKSESGKQLQDGTPGFKQKWKIINQPYLCESTVSQERPRNRSCDQDPVPTKMRLPLKMSVSSSFKTSTDHHMSVISQTASQHHLTTKEQIEKKLPIHQPKSRNPKQTTQSLTSEIQKSTFFRPQSRQTVQIKQLSTHVDPKRGKFQSTGNFNMKFKGIRPIHHNPYESFPTTVVVKQSNNNESNLNIEESIDVLTQMNEQQSENTNKFKRHFLAEFNSPKKSIVKLPTRSRNYLIDRSSTDINIQNLIQKQKHNQQSCPQIKKLKVQKMQKIFWSKPTEPSLQTVKEENVCVLKPFTRRYNSQKPLFRQVDEPCVNKKRNSSLANLLCWKKQSDSQCQLF